MFQFIKDEINFIILTPTLMLVKTLVRFFRLHLFDLARSIPFAFAASLASLRSSPPLPAAASRGGSVFCVKGIKRQRNKRVSFRSFPTSESLSATGLSPLPPFPPSLSKKKIPTSISAFAALSRASLSILSTLSASRLRPLAYVWNVPLPAPAADPCTLDTIVGTFCVMNASFCSSSSACRGVAGF